MPSFSEMSMVSVGKGNAKHLDGVGISAHFVLGKSSLLRDTPGPSAIHPR